MPRELKNATITHVSYVDKAANRRKFFFTKSEEAPTFEKTVKLLTKADDAQQLVYGVVYEPDIEDAHGDFMTAEEIEKAAHSFLKDYRNLDTQHDFKSGVGEVVESYVAPSDFTVGEETITKGSWVMVTKATDEIWEQIQKGELTGYSMAGVAEVIEKDEAKEEGQLKAFFSTMKAFFTGEKEEVQKGAVKDKFNQRVKASSLWTAWDSFMDCVRNYNWNTEQYEYGDETEIREAITDLSDILTQVLTAENIFKALGKPTEEIQKAGKKISAARLDKLKEAQATIASIIGEVEEKEDDEVKAEDIQKMLDDALAPVVSRLDAIEKGEEPTTEPVAKEDNQEDLVKAMGEVIQKSLAPIMERLEVVEKARGIQKAAEPVTEQPSTEQVEKSIFSGVLFRQN